MEATRRSPARLLLLRHPETDWNREGRWQGHADQPLNTRGREQMLQGLAELPPERFAAIYTSDLLRAQEAALWLGTRLGLTPRIESSLRERAMGEWDGWTPGEARARWPDDFRRVEADPLREAPPGGESFRELLARVLPVLQRIAGFHGGEAAIVVTHGGILKALVCALLDLDLRERETLALANSVQVLFEVEGPRWTLLKPDRLAERQSLWEPHEALR